MAFIHGDNKGEYARLIAEMTAEINALHKRIDNLKNELHKTDPEPTEQDKLKAELDCSQREAQRLRAENDRLKNKKRKNNIINLKKGN